MEDLNKIAPKLSKQKKENPYRVPDNYFDDFSARLQTRLESEKHPIPEKGKVIRLLKPMLGLAASFALIFMLVYWPLDKFLSDNVAENITEEINTVDDHYLSMMESIDEESFYDLLEQQEITEEYSDDELISYLSASVSDYDIYLESDY